MTHSDRLDMQPERFEVNRHNLVGFHATVQFHVACKKNYSIFIVFGSKFATNWLHKLWTAVENNVGKLIANFNSMLSSSSLLLVLCMEE